MIALSVCFWALEWILFRWVLTRTGSTVLTWKIKFFAHFKAWLRYVAGRYNIIATQTDTSRFYKNPAGTNGTIFDSAEKQVASSLALCFERPVQNHPLYDHSEIGQGNGNYFLVYIRGQNARRADPNCYLNLQELSEHRFWLTFLQFEQNGDHRLGICTDLVANTRHVMSETNAAHITALPLSGVQDSRLLTAMAAPELKNVGLSCAKWRMDFTWV